MQKHSWWPWAREYGGRTYHIRQRCEDSKATYWGSNCIRKWCKDSKATYWGSGCIRQWCKGSMVTYWRDSRRIKHLDCYRHCNGREESEGNSIKYMGTSPVTSGRNSTKHTGASPMMPVTRETWSDRRVKQTCWESMSMRGGRRATSRSHKWLRKYQRWREFIRSQPKGWPIKIHNRIPGNNEQSNWTIA